MGSELKSMSPRVDAFVDARSGPLTMVDFLQLAFIARRIENELSALKQREGWVAVPAEPSEEMIQAAMPPAFIGHPEASEESKARWWKSHRLAAIEKYKAMLSAAPKSDERK